MGEPLEYYVKDMFANSFHLLDKEEKIEAYKKYFSLLGNQNNPPDFILAQSDAVEVKKIENITNGLALNSSSPKEYLYANDPKTTDECRKCEDSITPWKVKDILYVIGAVKEGKITSLWFVYGNCYAASSNVYRKIMQGIARGIRDIPDIAFKETMEVEKVNKVDPLGITYLRIRGMWGIKSPATVFKYLYTHMNTIPTLNVVLLRSKYDNLKKDLRTDEVMLLEKSFLINPVSIANPNNPAQQLDAVYITGNL